MNTFIQASWTPDTDPTALGWQYRPVDPRVPYLGLLGRPGKSGVVAVIPGCSGHVLYLNTYNLTPELYKTLVLAGCPTKHYRLKAWSIVNSEEWTSKVLKNLLEILKGFNWKG